MHLYLRAHYASILCMAIIAPTRARPPARTPSRAHARPRARPRKHTPTQAHAWMLHTKYYTSISNNVLTFKLWYFLRLIKNCPWKRITSALEIYRLDLREVGRRLFPQLGELSLPSSVPFIEWQSRESNYKSSEIQVTVIPFDTTWTSRSPRTHPLLSESPQSHLQCARL